MAYCRWSESSDVYLIGLDTGIYCVSCELDGSHLFATKTEAITHLLRHRELGHKVPDTVIEGLEEERKMFGDYYDCEE